MIVHQQKKTARLSGEGQWLSRKNVFSDFRGVFFGDLLSNKTNITLMSGVDFRAESPQTMPHKDNDNFIIKTILIHNMENNLYLHAVGGFIITGHELYILVKSVLYSEFDYTGHRRRHTLNKHNMQ